MVMRMPEVPDSVEELRYLLRRERRDADRREGEKVDHRIFQRERRVGERRGPGREAFADTDPSMRLSEFEEVVIELAEDDMEEVEQTLVRARPAAARLGRRPKAPSERTARLAKRELDLPALVFAHGADRLAVAGSPNRPRPRPRRRRAAAAASPSAPTRAAPSRP